MSLDDEDKAPHQQSEDGRSAEATLYSDYMICGLQNDLVKRLYEKGC